MKDIANYPDLATAELIRSVLEARGMPAQIPDSNLVSWDWRLGTAVGGVRLQVESRHVDAAMELLDVVSAGEDKAGPGEFSSDEICPYCNSTHIGPERHRRLKALMLLLAPVSIIALPKILFSRNRVRCGKCNKVWRNGAQVVR